MTMTIENLHEIPSELYNAVLSQVQGVQNTILAQSGDMFDRGGTLVASAQDAISRIVDSLVDPVSPTEPTATPVAGIGAYVPPTLPGMGTITVPTIPSIPMYVSSLGELNLPDITVPEPPVGAPVVAIPAPPTAAMPVAPNQPVVDLDVTMPTAPTLALPTAPTIHGITLPSLPTISIPTFDATLPDWEEPKQYIPSNISAQVGDVIYDETLLNAFAERALTKVPATLVDVTTQEALRQADLLNAQADRDVNLVWDEFASKGFTAPPGTIGQRVDAIRADTAAKVRVISRETAMTRMQLEIDAYKTNMSAGVELAKKQIDKELEKKRLLLEIHTATAKQMIDMYNASVEVFKAKQSGYQALVEIFKAKLDGELAKVNIYKAQVEGQKVVVDAEVAQMQGYEAQVRGLLAAVDIFKAQVSATQTEMEVKAKRLEVFRTQVEAFVAQVNAVKAQYDVYESQVKAAITPVTIYESQMRAYSAQVDGVRAQADIIRTKAETGIAVEEANIKGYLANVDMVVKSAEVGIEGAKLEAQVMRNTLDVHVAQAQTGTEAYRAQVEAYKANIQQSLAGFEAAIKKWEVVYQTSLKKAELRIEATKGAAQISSQLAASALAGFHVQSGLSGQASLGLTGQTGGHWNYNYGESHQFTGE